jgi:hypothetical protein
MKKEDKRGNANTRNYAPIRCPNGALCSSARARDMVVATTVVVGLLR